MASDSRTNAGHDQVNIARKMHVFVQPGERVFILLSSGSLSCTQSIITLLRRDFGEGQGLAQASSLYDAARIIGEEVDRRSHGDVGAHRRVQGQQRVLRRLLERRLVEADAAIEDGAAVLRLADL